MKPDICEPATPIGAEAPAAIGNRRLIGLVIIAFLISQIAIPASYYFQSSVTNERFSWRMFSSIDRSSWNTRIWTVTENLGMEQVQEIPLASIVQETHVKAVQAAQLDVVEPLMRRLLYGDGVREVRYEAQGTLPNGVPIPPIRMVLRRGESLISSVSP